MGEWSVEHSQLTDTVIVPKEHRLAKILSDILCAALIHVCPFPKERKPTKRIKRALKYGLDLSALLKVFKDQDWLIILLFYA